VTWIRRLALAAAAVALVAALGWLVEELLIDYAVRVLLLCGINVILAVGLNLVNGTTGQFSIGHAGFMAVGAYACAVTVIGVESALAGALAGLPGWVARGLALNAGLVVGALAAGLAGALVGGPSLRLRGDYLAIVTLGFGEIIRLVFTNAEALGGATGYSGGRPMGLPTYTNFFWVYAWVLLVTVLVASLTRSSWGRSLSQIREDEISAEAMGIPTTRLKIVAFVVSSMAAGVAGGLFAHLQGMVRPDDFKFDRSIDVIVMVIVGGLGSISGSVLGAFLITLLLAGLIEALDALGWRQEYRLIVYPIILVSTMLFRPQGLLGRKELRLPWLAARGGAAKPAGDGTSAGSAAGGGTSP
jgi:branched-chain amino acid transport system permease protein